jgi:hypothetical protein
MPFHKTDLDFRVRYTALIATTIQVRPITCKESKMLDRWQRLDDIVRCRRARILRLSESKWKCPVIAEALGLHVETARQLIKAFNEGGIPAITRNPRSGGRSPGYSEEVAEVAERLVRQEPPHEEGRATRTLHGLAKPPQLLVGASGDMIPSLGQMINSRHIPGRRIAKSDDFAGHRPSLDLSTSETTRERHVQ